MIYFLSVVDSIYVHPLNVYNLERIKLSNKLYNINFTGLFIQIEFTIYFLRFCKIYVLFEYNLGRIA